MCSSCRFRHSPPASRSYGYINTSIEPNRGICKARNTAIGKIAEAATVNRDRQLSRFGFRGREDLAAVFTRISSSKTASVLTTVPRRQRRGVARHGSVLGNAALGEVKFGYGLTPYDDVLGLRYQNIGSTGAPNRNNGVSGGPGFGFNQLLFTIHGQRRQTVSGVGTTGQFRRFRSRTPSATQCRTGGFHAAYDVPSVIEKATSPKARLWTLPHLPERPGHPRA